MTSTIVFLRAVCFTASRLPDEGVRRVVPFGKRGRERHRGLIGTVDVLVTGAVSRIFVQD